MAIDMFISYSHRDEKFRKELEMHLSNLKNQGLITAWYDGDIVPGTEWEPQLLEHLKTANIILLLISAHFMASPFCQSVELKQALARHEANQARVLPIILKPVDWEGAPFAKVQALPTYGRPVSRWTNRDEAFKDVIQGIRKAIQDLNSRTAPPSVGLSKATGTASVAIGQVSVWNVPFPHNLFFTGREDILSNLHTLLEKTHAAALSQPLAVNGLGGIGKTQTAVEYAYRYKKEYQAICWVKSSSPEELAEDFASLAGKLGLPEHQAHEQARVIAAVKAWFETHTHWLLIFDNADELTAVYEYLPQSRTGHVLLTTRDQVMGAFARKIAVEEMSPETGALLLLRRAGLLAPDASLEQASPPDVTIAKELSEEMGGLPLALYQAAAYIDETACGLDAYKRLYQQQRQSLLRYRGDFISEHPEPIATTWLLSFSNVERANLAAADLLRLCAFLAPDAIPEEILTKGADELGPNLQPLASDPMKLDMAIKALRKYSLVKRGPDRHMLNIHRLVQAVLRDEMNEETQQQWATRTVRAVNAAFPKVEYQRWADCQRYLLHAKACASLVEKYKLAFPEAAQLLTRTGCYLRERALYPQAEPLLNRALAIRELVLDPRHPDIASTLSELASLYRLQGRYFQVELQGRYVQVEHILDRTLAIRKQVLDPRHPDIASTLNNLADLYYVQGKYKQSEELYQQALTIIKETFGPQHPDIADTLNGLALLYYRQGKYKQSEELYQQALTIKKETSGPQHPSTARTLSQLALLYQAQGRYEDAEEFYRQALERYLETLSYETNVAVSGTALDQRADCDKGSFLVNTALAIGEKVLETHPSIAFTLGDLASLYHAQGKHEQAEKLYKRALDLKKKQLGSQHPGTATTLGHLALLYQDQGRYKDAEELYQQALTINEETRGPEHPNTAQTLNNLANLYSKQGEYEQAEPLFQRALTIYEQRLGPDHPRTVEIRNRSTNESEI